MKNLTALLILCAAFFAFAADAARAQNGSVTARNSEITAAQMPAGAERLLPESVPAEFNRAFDNLLKQGDGKVAGGAREILAWRGDYKSAASRAKSIAQMQANFRSAGWQYTDEGKEGDMALFTLKQNSPRRVALGFFVPGDDVMVCAILEILLPGEKSSVAETPINQPTKKVNNEPTTAKYDPSAKVVSVEKNAKYVNLMGTELPPMPDFPQLAPKPGKVRGYIKDWTGKPLAGAQLGIRASYLAGMYSGGQGVTDANGYYEFAPPKGMAHFYNAGYQIEWGDGVAAVSLHPVDGKLDSFVTTDGAVENFVMLPYGITSRENLQENPNLPSTFYGGAIFFNWYSVEANDNNAPPFAVRAGGTLEITLTPEGEMLDGTAGQTIVIRKTLGISGAFRVHNIPLGRYRISVKADGEPLKIKDSKTYDAMFGLTPAGTTGEASILFVPDQAKASMVGPQNGAWKWVSLNLSTP